MFFPTSSEIIPVTSLAEWAAKANVRTVDFIKLNVQGAEHEILHGAGEILDSALGVLIEVAFVKSYRGRPFFSDTDRFLRAKGFTFFDLLAHHYIGRADAPIAAQHLAVVEPKLGQLVSSWGQLVEGHALYLKDPVDSGELELTRIIKLIAIAEAFGQIEYAFELLGWLAAKVKSTDSPLSEACRQLLSDGADRYNTSL